MKFMSSKPSHNAVINPEKFHSSRKSATVMRSSPSRQSPMRSMGQRLPSLSNNMRSPNPYDNIQEKMRLKAEIKDTRERIAKLGSVGQVHERA